MYNESSQFDLVGAYEGYKGNRRQTGNVTLPPKTVET